MSGRTPLVTLKDYEKNAKKSLPKFVYDYYSSGAGEEKSLSWNKLAFDRYRIRPRFLRDVSKTSMSTELLGCKMSMPVGISPTAMQRLAHPDGECANAAACGEAGVIFTLSTIATSSIEQVADSAPNTNKWFQLYIYKDREITKQLVRRAERCGYKALVLTVDAPSFGIRYADVRNRFQMPPHLTMANFTGELATKASNESGGSGINEYVGSLFDQTLVWDDVKWLKELTSLPIVLKGILTAEDAIIGTDLGVAGILVSNHGARQVDKVPAPIEVLPEIVRAVGDRCDVYLDGGVYSGSDIFIALALGAKMVFVGRPALWGLAHDGRTGVKNVLELLRNELRSVMMLSGCASISDIKREMVVQSSLYSNL